MDIVTLKTFFMWCTIMDAGLLVLWSLVLLVAANFVYNMRHKWFPLPRETYNVLMYSFLGLFKMFVLSFNLVPYIALAIMS